MKALKILIGVILFPFVLIYICYMTLKAWISVLKHVSKATNPKTDELYRKGNKKH